MFQSARIRLTLWYLLIIMLISSVFSTVIYSIVSGQIEGLIRMQNDRIMHSEYFVHGGKSSPNKPPEPPIISTTELKNQEKQLALTLFFVNIGILALAGGSGYFLAGRTLRPIKIMIDEQDQFISDSSHELRTPIATLRAEMEGKLLEKHISDEDARKLIKSNLEELESLQTLTNNLLRLAGNKQGIHSDLKDEIVLSDVIESAINKVNLLAQNKQIEIKRLINDCHLSGDKTGLVELFVILLDNAIKYSPEKTEIKIISEKSKDSVEIKVTDQGVGVAEKDLPHIFKRFYRADKSRSEVTGYGLGLSIAKKIIITNAGSINATNNPEGGATFTVILPLFYA
jgi:two-component system, OmpR family, sensor histidine kinase CiaH